MEHRAIYVRLLSPQNEPALLSALEKQGVFSLVRARSAVVCRDHSPPYVLMIVDADRGVSAHCMCVFLKVDSLVPEHGPTLFYLPIIAVSQVIHASGGRATVALQHELRHLEDTLALVESDPSYAQRIFEYGMNNTSDPALLTQTIDLEVFTLFSLEPQAFALDYDNGETALEIPFLGRVVRVACYSQEEFVHHRIAEYVAGFEREFSDRFPAHQERIHADFERAVNNHGCALLGPAPYRRIGELKAGVVTKMLDPERRVRAKVGALVEHLGLWVACGALRPKPLPSSP